MSTAQVTEAHRELAFRVHMRMRNEQEDEAWQAIADSEARAERCLVEQLALVNTVCDAALKSEAALIVERDQLNAEAKAVAEALVALTCTHHTSGERRECPVCLVTKLRAEVDQLRARCDELIESQETVDLAFQEQYARATYAEAESDQLRRELDDINGLSARE